ELRQILEQGVAGTEDGATPGQFPQVSGISFSFDDSGQAIEFDDDGNLVTDGNRIQSAAITDEDGNIVDVLVENGQLVGDPDRNIRIVTLNFLADGGDGYPFDVFGEDRVDLFREEEDPRTGAATFAPDGTEQDAFAEFLAENFANTPFSEEETAPEDDTRIQNLDVRSDTVLTGGATGSLIGTLGDDDISGTDADETLRGNDGDDILAGLGGADDIFGGRGDDEMDGGAGDDNLRGLAGDDTIAGGAGSDRMLGNAGDDTMTGNAGDDTMRGGSGNDEMRGGVGDDVIRGAKDDDILFGGAGADEIRGGQGDDQLFGNAGDDLLRADGGDDLLNGGLGDDEIRTGAGSDSVVLESGAGTDTVFRFNVEGNDTFELLNILFEDLTLSVDGGDTTISLGSETLAVVINNSSLSADNFVSVLPVDSGNGIA
ncbi:MAG: 5'-nucleotidase C-terminal domain-containing protein, partial [Cyanobacteria bacterium P01_A01_bin.135]